MIRRLFHMALALMLLSACGHHAYSPSLQRADSLCSERPDSAVLLLQLLKSKIANSPKADRMFYELLCIKAADKTDRPITHCDSTILRLIEYYENEGEPAKLAETYYYAGRIFYVQNRYGHAMVFFQKGIDVINSSDNPKLGALLNTHIGRILIYHTQYDEALKHFKESYRVDSILEDKRGLIYDMVEFSNIYKFQKAYLKAEKTLHEAKEMSLKYGDKSLASNIGVQLAGLYYMKGQYEKSLSYIHEFGGNVTKDDESPLYAMAALNHMVLGNADSAEYYYHKVEEYGTVYAKERAYQDLVVLASNKKDYNSVSRYLSLYKEYNDSVIKLTNAETVAKWKAAYDYSLKEKEVFELKRANLNNRILLGIAILIFAVTIAMLYYFIRRLQRKRLQERENYKAYRQMVVAAEKASQNLQTTESESEDIQFNALLEIILSRKKSYRHLTDEEWKQFEDIVNSKYPGFSTILRRYYPKISRHEFRVSLSSKYGLKSSEIAILTAHSRQSVDSTCVRLFKKVMGKEGLKADWDIFIQSI